MTREELERIKSFYKDSPATKGSTAAFLYDAMSALEEAWVVIANLQQQNTELLEDIGNMAQKGSVAMIYPRIRDLPAAEQEPFSRWLAGQTCPIYDTTEPEAEWDWYYPSDYERWKAGLTVVD